MSLFKRLKNIISAEIDSRKLNNEGTAYRPYTNLNEGRDKDEGVDTSGHFNSKEQQYLANLELNHGANFEEIKTAYKKLMRKYHPDKFHSDDRGKYANEITKKLNEAYEYFKEKHKGQ